jgi:hypothetical protein
MHTLLALPSVLAWVFRADAVEVLVHSQGALIGRDRQGGLDLSAVAQEPPRRTDGDSAAREARLSRQ